MAATDDDSVTIVEFSSDISEAEAPEPLPVGQYNATIRAAEVKVSTNSGNRYAAVSFHIAPDEYPADYPTDIAPDGKVIIHRRLVMEDDARSKFNVRKFCEAIGAPMSKKIDVGDWVGLEARITIAHGTWEGMVREEIERVSEA
jgi:hypothetical protein